jgi:hypothetical protein
MGQYWSSDNSETESVAANNQSKSRNCEPLADATMSLSNDNNDNDTSNRLAMQAAERQLLNEARALIDADCPSEALNCIVRFLIRCFI